MAQETRKDPRAKVLTMTVRYKSATVDEFIEHHSHDVSRGGIFIKTPSPFLPGTLLKFEIRIADDKAMLQGVGRVVWKRDSAGSGPDKPAGMGVKFIKVDEASRTLIDRLVVSKGGGVSAFDDETSQPAAEAPAPAAAAAAPAPAGPPRVSPSKSTPAPPRVAADGAAKSNVRKATMIGLGAEAIAAAAAQPPRPRSNAPGAPAPAPMFPKTDSEGDMPPPEERTVMKQAAQLLEEALRGAGGSIDELGSPAAPAETPRPPRREPEHEVPPASGRTVGGAAGPDRRAAPPAAGVRPSDNRVATAGKRPSVRPPSQPPRAEAGPALVEPSGRKKSSGGRVGVSLLLVAGAAAAAYVAWQQQAPAPIDTPPPAAHAAAPPVTAAPLPAPTPAPLPTPAPTAAPTETAVVAPIPVASAAPAVSAAPTVAGKTPPASTAAAPGVRPTSAGETTPAAATAEKPAAAVPAPVAKPKPKPAPPVGEEGATPAPPVEKKPKPAPAPKPSDDNPY
jgi:uncharacterized protein (TIGR02266 family)